VPTAAAFQPVARRSPTFRLLLGLGIMSAAVAVFFIYSIHQLRSLRELQTQTIDRNRKDALVLLRIQNDLNSLGLSMRDTLQRVPVTPVLAWEAEFRRMRADLDDALVREARYSSDGPRSRQSSVVRESFQQFWTASVQVFELARSNREADAADQIRAQLLPRQTQLSLAISQLLLAANEGQESGSASTRTIYDRFERNAWTFGAAIFTVIVVSSLWLVQYSRRLFEQVAALSKRRSELVRQLISMQETTYRSISRELHDEFGQILTAIGLMLHRADRKPGDLREVQELVQATLEKVRSLSYALHPVILTEVGLESALDVYISGFSKRTGMDARYIRPVQSVELDSSLATHLYRVAQEALNNAAKHSRSKSVTVALAYEQDAVVLEIRDLGVGFAHQGAGLGLVSMRERVELIKGTLEFVEGNPGAIVRVVVPIQTAGVGNA
jgi:signal transduction histidine kinase